MGYEAISGYDAPMHRSVFVCRNGRFIPIKFIGTNGKFDSLPIWHWEEKGVIKNSYSAIFYVKVEPKYRLEYFDCGEWHKFRSHLSRRSASALMRNNQDRYELRVVAE